MKQLLPIVQIVLAVLLMGAILLQNRGVGLGGVFGGEGNVYRTKRGAEKFIYLATIVIASLFFASALFSIILNR